jgi:hypothetical protein
MARDKNALLFTWAESPGESGGGEGPSQKIRGALVTLAK